MSDFSCNVEEIDFDQLVVARSYEIPVLVDISADWCAPCRVLAPLLHKLVVAYDGKFILGMVDADENMRIAGRHQVRGFPTVTVWRSTVFIVPRPRIFCVGSSIRSSNGIARSDHSFRSLVVQ